MAEATIDLHLHSIHSDGTDDTGELLSIINETGLSIVSFTDHDSVSIYDDLPKFPDRTDGLKIVTGVELSFASHGYSRDMMGYGIDVQAMQKVLDEWYTPEKRLWTQRQTLIGLKDVCRRHSMVFDEDIDVSTGKKTEAFILLYESLMQYPENLERFPFLKVNTEFYWHYVAKQDSPFFVDETFSKPGFKDVVEAIHDTGGMAFLAHPCGYRMCHAEVDGFVREAARQGVKGIEVQHETYSQEDMEFLKGLANELNLYQSGGSDYHGGQKPGLMIGTAFGNVMVRLDEIEPWVDKVRIYGQ